MSYKASFDDECREAPSSWEHQYLNLVAKILREGDDREDRTGTGTRALFGERLDIDLKQGFPAMTTKKLAWKAMVSELLWFIEGSGDERRLCELLHGTRDPSKKTIWSANAEGTKGAAYKPQFEGDLGRVYGVQWRHWRKYTPSEDQGRESGTTRFEETEVDQLQELIKKLKTNPTDRRMIISAWNVGELDQMALPPCHLFSQFFVAQNKDKPRYLSCQMYMRSCDVALGLPFNVASYALLTHLLAHVTNCVPDRLIINMGDTHLYRNHLEGAEEQLTRTPQKEPFLLLNEFVTDIEKFKLNDIVLMNYTPLPAIKMEMST